MVLTSDWLLCYLVIARRISGARKGSSGTGGTGQLAGAKMWSSMGDMLEGEDETDERKKVTLIP